MEDDRLDVCLNPCYSKAEIKAEIRATLSKQQQDRVPSRWERLGMGRGRTVRPQRTEKTIADMRVGEVGYIVSWAVGDWDWLPYPEHLDGLNLTYSVEPSSKRGSNTHICRTETGWVVGGKVFTESKVVKTSRKGVKMAKPKTNLIIEECKSVPNLLKVWVLEPAAAKKSIEAIEGVTYVTHYVKEGYLNAWLNPCYSKAELKAEIERLLREKLIFSSDVELVPPGTLTKYEYKARLVEKTYEK